MSAQNKQDEGYGGQPSITSGTHYHGLNSVVLNPNLIIVTPDTQEIHWLEGGCEGMESEPRLKLLLHARDD